MKQKFETNNAPGAIGPYSQSIKAGNTLYISGQLPIDPEMNAFAGSNIAAQTRQCLKNMQAILEAAGGDMTDVVKTTVMLKDMADFAAMNEVYATFFTGDCPARAAYQVAALPKDALVEIEAIAVLEGQPCLIK